MASRANVRRWQHMAAIGCVACYIEGLGYNAPDMHHILSGGRRMGHEHTIALCPWHHRAVPPAPYTAEDCRAQMGPSLAEGEPAFYARYGSNLELWQLQERLIQRHLERSGLV